MLKKWHIIYVIGLMKKKYVYIYYMGKGMHIGKSKGERKNGGRKKLVNKHYQQWEWVVLRSGFGNK